MLDPVQSDRDSDDLGVVVRPVTLTDLAATAAWHCRHLPHGLFPLLGQRFVRRWHATFIGADHGIALLAELPGTGTAVPVGFLVGSTHQVRHVEDVIAQHRLRLGLAGLGALLLRPRVLLMFVRTRARSYLRRLLGLGRARTPVQELQPAPRRARQVAVVTAVVVDPSARGARIGQALLEAFVARSVEAGAPQAELVTKAGPDGAGRFYERLGWERVEEHPTRDGIVMRTYRLGLARRSATVEGRAAGQT